MFCERRYKYEGEHILQKWTTVTIWVCNKASIYSMSLMQKIAMKSSADDENADFLCCQNQWFAVLFCFFLVVSFHTEASLWIIPEALNVSSFQFGCLYWHICLLEWVVKFKMGTMPLCVLRVTSLSPSLEIWLEMCPGHALIMTGRRSRELPAPMERKSTHTTLK